MLTYIPGYFFFSDQNMQRFVREVLQFKSLVQQFFHLEGKLANRLFEEIEKKHSNVKDNLLKYVILIY